MTHATNKTSHHLPPPLRRAALVVLGWSVAIAASAQEPPAPTPGPVIPPLPPRPLEANSNATAADPSLFPAAVPPSAPEGLDPGATPSAPMFGPHAGNITMPNNNQGGTTTSGTRLPAPGNRPLLPPQKGESSDGLPGGISESDIRAYVIPEMDLTPVQTEPGGAVWERNAPLAFHKAKTLQRPLLLLFTAQWNNVCQKLSEEVFTSKSFNEFARDHCVICFVDYPQNINHATESMVRVRKKYQVRGYPTLLVFDPDGNVVRQITGYRPGRPVAYFNELFGAVDPLAIHLKARKEKLMQQGYRDWTNSTGATVFAAFDSHNGEKVLIRGPANDRWILPITTLSTDDQALVRSFPTWEEMQEMKQAPQ